MGEIIFIVVSIFLFDHLTLFIWMNSSVLSSKYFEKSPGLLSLSSISVIICFITSALVCFITCFFGQPPIVSPGLLLSLSSISVI